jgi:hypothetical protein
MTLSSDGSVLCVGTACGDLVVASVDALLEGAAAAAAAAAAPAADAAAPAPALFPGVRTPEGLPSLAGMATRTAPSGAPSRSAGAADLEQAASAKGMSRKALWLCMSTEYQFGGRLQAAGR